MRLCIRSIRACPGTTFCKLGRQDALGVGLALDEKYHGMELPGKFKMAVSGCRLSCSESWMRDIGLIGQKNGWQVVGGGNVGAAPAVLHDDHCPPSNAIVVSAKKRGRGQTTFFLVSIRIRPVVGAGRIASNSVKTASAWGKKREGP